MSLEAAILELVETNKKLVDVTERLLNVRVDAIETVKTAAAPAAKAAETKKATTEPPAETKPVETKPADDAAAAKIAAAQSHPVGAKIYEYTTAGYAEDHPQAAEERAARVAKVKAIYSSISSKIGTPVNSFADIPAEWNDTVLGKLAVWTADGPLVIKSTPSLDL